MSYAEGTEVPIERSKAEVERLLKKAGATQYFSGEVEDRFVVGCKLNDRLVRFQIPVPVPSKPVQRLDWINRETRRRWRCLALAIKSKLVVVESGIKSFEEEFLSDIVMADSKTVYEHVRQAIDDSYKTGKVRGPLLLGPAE